MELTFKQTSKGLEARVDGALFTVSRRYTGTVPLDRPVRVMITGGLKTHPAGFIVEPVGPEHVLVEHKGFECSGSMCRTTARGRVIETDRPIFLTPGRVEDLLHVADNVNVGWHGQAEAPLVPGKVWVTRGENRAAGLDELDDHARLKQAQIAEWRRKINDRKPREN